MKVNKITKEKIVSLIKEEVEVTKRKKEIYSEVIKLNEELKKLYEERGITGTFGFANNPNDGMHKGAASGFKEPQNISYITQLEKEFDADDAIRGKNEEIEENIEDKNVEEAGKTMIALQDENAFLKEKIAKIEDALKITTK